MSPAPAAARPNIRLASQEAARLLALTPVPANSVALTKPPAVPSRWFGPVVASRVDRSRAWRVPLSMSAAAGWIAAHPPAGLTLAESGTGFAPGVFLYGYAGAASRAWNEADLTVQLASAESGATILRADALVVWLDPVPDADSAHGNRMRVSVSGGCPRSDAAVVGVTNHGADLRTRMLPAASPMGGLVCGYQGMGAFRLHDASQLNPAQARAVAAKLAGLPLAHDLGAASGCPADLGLADVVALSYPGRADVDVWVRTTGCGYAANGFIVAGEDRMAGADSCSADGWAACVRP